MRQCARGWPARSERRSRGGQGHREEHKYHCGGGGMRPCACSSVGQHTCGSIRVRTCRSPVRRGCRLVHGQGGRLTHSMRSIRVATTRPAGRVWTAICGWLCVDGCVWIAMCGWCGWPRADDRLPLDTVSPLPRYCDPPPRCCETLCPRLCNITRNNKILPGSQQMEQQATGNVTWSSGSQRAVTPLSQPRA
eukprot:365706-Chlamydomonas_euryale.AAC.15